MRVPLNVPSIDAAGAPLADGARIEITWPGGVEVPPEHTEVASVERADGQAMQVVKEIYRSSGHSTELYVLGTEGGFDFSRSSSCS